MEVPVPLKLTKNDMTILLAALNAALEGDTDQWDELSGTDLDRARDLMDEFEARINRDEEDEDDDEDEDEEEDEDWTGYSNDDDDDA